MKDVVSLILGGGRGTRLYPLTKHRSKPAVPIGGKYRLIDIPISNCLNSGLNRIYVLTQFLSVSLHRHIANSYKLDHFSGGFVEVLAAQQTMESTDWYQGTADAVRQNLVYVQEPGVREALILSGDQVYRMDFRTMVEAHRAAAADISIAVIPVARSEARAFGVMQINNQGRVIGFVEKPQSDEELDCFRAPTEWIARHGIDPRGRQYLASMGIYLFNRDVLVERLSRRPAFADFGRDLFPNSYREYHVHAHLYDGYWEDVGTIKAYHRAHMAMTGDTPPFYFHAPEGVIYTRMRFLPASRISAASIDHCLISDGCIVQAGACLSHSVVGIRSRLGANVTLKESVVIGADRYETDEERLRNRALGFPDIGIGEGSVVERAIIDKDCRVGRGVRIVNRRGVTEEEGDYYSIRDGIICIPKAVAVPDGTII